MYYPYMQVGSGGATLTTGRIGCWNISGMLFCLAPVQLRQRCHGATLAVDSSQNTFLNVLSSSFPFNFIGGQFPAMLLLCILADRIIRQPQRCCVGIVCSVGDVVRKIKTASVCCTKRTEVVLRVGGAARKFLTMQPPISSRPALLCYYFCYRRYSYRRNYTLS